MRVVRGMAVMLCRRTAALEGLRKFVEGSGALSGGERVKFQSVGSRAQRGAAHELQCEGQGLLKERAYQRGLVLPSEGASWS